MRTDHTNVHRLSLWSNRPAYSFRQVLPISEDSIRDRARRAGVASKHGAGYGGLVKTFLSRGFARRGTCDLPNDTDMLFWVDPYLLE